MNELDKMTIREVNELFQNLHKQLQKYFVKMMDDNFSDDKDKSFMYTEILMSLFSNHIELYSELKNISFIKSLNLHINEFILQENKEVNDEKVS